MTQRLEGRPVAETLLRQAREEAAKLPRPPHLVVVLVGDDGASATYVASKERKCQELGFRSRTVRLPATVTAAALTAAIDTLNADDDVDGILLQLPLPAHLPRRAILDRIDAAKDVDGLHPLNAGRLVFGEPGPVPCTPAGVLELLKFYQIPLAGKRAVVVGRSEIVGKPMVSLLLGADMTVTVAHSRTPDLAAVTREADVLVVAAGKPKLVGAKHVRPGATVVDVGIHRIDGKLVGDVDAAAVEGIAGGLTPVPRGVGPMTIAQLMLNLVRLAAARA